MKIIEITVSPTGETKVETKGFSGSECLRASREIEKALGVSGESKKTAEYYATMSVDGELRNTSR